MTTHQADRVRLSDLFRDGHASAVLVLCGGFLLAAMTMYITSALMPSVVAEIGGQELYALPTTVYVVVSVIGVMSVSQLLARLGPRGAYLLAFATYVIGAAICALAPTMPALLVGRGIVGFGGGLLSGLGYAVVRSALPSRLWSPATGAISAMFGIGTLIGPVLGGLFAQFGAWRLAFGLIALLGVVLGVLAPRALERRATGVQTEPVPILAVALLASAIGLLSVASVIDGQLKTMLIIAAALLVIAFLARDRSAPFAVFPRSTYRRGSALRWVLLTNALTTVAIVSEAFAPLFGQRMAGLTPLVAGFFAAAVSVGWSAFGLLGARVSGARWRGRLTIIGPALLAVGLLITALTQAEPASPQRAALWFILLIIAGAGIGFSFPNISFATLSTVPKSEAGKAGAAIPMVGLIGQSFGSALAGVLVNLGLPSMPHAATNLFLGLAVLAGIGTITAAIAVRRGAFTDGAEPPVG
ncbi:MAG: MFS transporter [Propionibacteriales bacterium]|nr:MFS transporter [Propionibacteriales bacterium]